MANNFQAARRNMVLSQINTDNVTDPRLQKAMTDVPRELFVPHTKRVAAYSSDNVEIGDHRVLLAPRTLGKMIHTCQITQTDEVLVIGAGTGYSAAIIAHLASVVVALESDQSLVDTATSVLMDLGIDNAAVVTGDLAAGHPAGAPYDVIFVDGAVDKIPTEIEDQLKEGGRLIALERQGPICRATLRVKSGPSAAGRVVFDAAGSVLPGFEQSEEFSF